MKTYTKVFTAIFLLSFMAVGFTSCNNEGCTDPLASNYDEDASKEDNSCLYDETNLQLHMHGMYGDDPFALNTEFTTEDGRKITWEIANFYLSNIRLVDGAGTETKLDAPGYAQWTSGTMMYNVGTVPAGNYKMIRFDIGVDSTANYSDPASYEDSHPLSSSSATFAHWSWSSGYLFVKMEGKVDASTSGNEAADDAFLMHVGNMNMLRSVELPVNFTVTEGQVEQKVHMDVDMKKFITDVDWMGNIKTHTMDDMPLATKIANNAATAIEIE